MHHRSGLLGGHSVGGMKSGVIFFSSWTVSLARWEKDIVVNTVVMIMSLFAKDV